MKNKITFRNRFFWLLYFTFVFGSLLPVASLLVFLSFFSKDPFFIFKCVSKYMTLAFKVGRIKIQISGKKNIPNDSEGFFIASNHQSFLDIPLILIKIKIIGFLAKIELSRIPFFKYVMLRSYCIFIDRKNPKTMKKTIRSIKENVNKGVAYAFFPEGSRTLDGKILPFKQGMLRISYNSKIPILPLSLNTWQVLPKKPCILTSETLKATVHSLVYPSDFNNFNDFSEVIKQKIKSAILT